MTLSGRFSGFTQAYRKDTLLHQLHQGLPLDVVELALNVCVHDKIVAPVAHFANRFQRLRSTPLRTKSITARLEVRLKDRFDHQFRRHLHHPVPHRRDPQWPLLPICFRYVPPLHRRRTISACPQRRLNLRNQLPWPSLFESLGCLRIHPRRATVVAHSPPCFPQNVTPVDPVVRRMEPPRPTLLGTHIYSLRWSCRTYSTGILAVSGMPSHLPPHKHDQSKAPSLQRVILRAFPGPVDPSDSLLAPNDFSPPALYARSLPDSAAR